MTEPSGTEVVRRPNRRRRVRVIGIVAGALLVIAAAAGWVLVADPFNPYRRGTTHAATLVHEQPWCANSWGVTLVSGVHHYHWGRGSAPREWDPGPVSGTLTILHDWGSTGTDAIFESNGQEVNLTGGSPSGAHFDDLSCTVK